MPTSGTGSSIGNSKNRAKKEDFCAEIVRLHEPIMAGQQERLNVNLPRSPLMSVVATEAGLADQVYTAFLRGDDSANEKQAELNNVRVIQAVYDAFLQG